MHLDELPFQYSRGELHEWLGAYVSKPFEVRRGECRGMLFFNFWLNLRRVACLVSKAVDLTKLFLQLTRFFSSKSPTGLLLLAECVFLGA